MPQARNTAPTITAPSPEALFDGSDAMVAEEIRAAIEMLTVQRNVQKDITDNRDTLRLLARRGKLSPVQTDWLEGFYPAKQKGERRSAEAIAKTRAYRAAALGVSVDEVGEDDES